LSKQREYWSEEPKGLEPNRNQEQNSKNDAREIIVEKL
jgi:hypothetical protein